MSATNLATSGVGTFQSQLLWCLIVLRIYTIQLFFGQAPKPRNASWQNNETKLELVNHLALGRNKEPKILERYLFSEIKIKS